MRTIVCRFRSEDELLEHLRQPTAEEAPSAITFLGDFEANAQELIKLILVIEDGRHKEQQCSARVQLSTRSRCPSMAQGERLWHYTGEFVEQDRVWLKMFMSKLRYAQRFEYALAV